MNENNPQQLNDDDIDYIYNGSGSQQQNPSDMLVDSPNAELTDDDIDYIYNGQHQEVPDNGEQIVLANDGSQQATQEGDYGFNQRQRDQITAESGREKYAGQQYVEGIAPGARAARQEADQKQNKALAALADGSAVKSIFEKYGDKATDDELKMERPGAIGNFVNDANAAAGRAVGAVAGVGARFIPGVHAAVNKLSEKIDDWTTGDTPVKRLALAARNAGFSSDDVYDAWELSGGDVRKFADFLSSGAQHEIEQIAKNKAGAQQRLNSHKEGFASKVASGSLGMIPMLEEFAVAGSAVKGGMKKLGLGSAANVNTWRGRLVEGLKHGLGMTAGMGTEMAQRRYSQLTSPDFNLGENGEVVITKGDENALGKAALGGYGEAAIFSLPIGEALVGWAPKAITKGLRAAFGETMAKTYQNYVRFGQMTGLRAQPMMLGLMNLNSFKDEVLGAGKRDAEYEGFDKEWQKFKDETLTLENQLDTFVSTLGVVGVQGGVSWAKARRAIQNGHMRAKDALRTYWEVPKEVLDKMNPEQTRMWDKMIRRLGDGSINDPSALIQRYMTRFGDRLGEKTKALYEDLAKYAINKDGTRDWSKDVNPDVPTRFTVPQQLDNDGNGIHKVAWNEYTDEMGRTVKYFTDENTGISVRRWMDTDVGGGDERAVYIIEDHDGRSATRFGLKDAVSAARDIERAGVKNAQMRQSKAQYIQQLYGKYFPGEKADIWSNQDTYNRATGKNIGPSQVAFNGNGRQVFFLDSFETPEQLMKTVLHEVGRHRGLEVMFPDVAKRTRFVQGLAKSDDPVVRHQLETIANARGITVEQALKDPNACEEVFAHLFDREGLPGNEDWLAQFGANMRTALRDHVFKNLPYSRAEAESIYRGAMENLSQRTGGLVSYDPTDVTGRLDAMNPEPSIAHEDREAAYKLEKEQRKLAGKERVAAKLAEIRGRKGEELQRKENEGRAGEIADAFDEAERELAEGRKLAEAGREKREVKEGLSEHNANMKIRAKEAENADREHRLAEISAKDEAERNDPELAKRLAAEEAFPDGESADADIQAQLRREEWRAERGIAKAKAEAEAERIAQEREKRAQEREEQKRSDYASADERARKERELGLREALDELHKQKSIAGTEKRRQQREDAAKYEAQETERAKIEEEEQRNRPIVSISAEETQKERKKREKRERRIAENKQFAEELAEEEKANRVKFTEDGIVIDGNEYKLVENNQARSVTVMDPRSGQYYEVMNDGRVRRLALDDVDVERRIEEDIDNAVKHKDRQDELDEAFKNFKEGEHERRNPVESDQTGNHVEKEAEGKENGGRGKDENKSGQNGGEETGKGEPTVSVAETQNEEPQKPSKQPKDHLQGRKSASVEDSFGSIEGMADDLFMDRNEEVKDADRERLENHARILGHIRTLKDNDRVHDFADFAREIHDNAPGFFGKQRNKLRKIWNFACEELGLPEVSADEAEMLLNAAENGRNARDVSGKDIIKKLTDNTPISLVEAKTLDRSDDLIPNMKSGANPETGIKTPLGGKPMNLLANPIVVMEFKDGRRAVVTGRHRAELYSRYGMKIPARVIYEKDGWTVDDAKMIDAVSNILDNQGDIQDYVNFFKESKLSKADAKAQGLLSKERGRFAFGIVNDLSADARAAVNFESRRVDGTITPEQAGIIAENAPLGGAKYMERVQRDAVAKCIKDPRTTGISLKGYIQESIADYKAAERASGADQMDFFGLITDGAAEELRERKADYRAQKQQEYARIANDIRRAKNSKGHLKLDPSFKKELGIRNANDASQLMSAIRKAEEISYNWGRDVLPDDLRAQMERDLGIAKDEPKSDFALESVTPQQLKQEADAQAQRDAIKDGIEKPLKGGGNLNVQPQFDLGQQGQGDLFAPIVDSAINKAVGAESNVKPKKVEAPTDAINRMGTKAYLPVAELKKELKQVERVAGRLGGKFAQRAEDLKSIVAWRESVDKGRQEAPKSNDEIASSDHFMDTREEIEDEQTKRGYDILKAIPQNPTSADISKAVKDIINGNVRIGDFRSSDFRKYSKFGPNAERTIREAVSCLAGASERAGGEVDEALRRKTRAISESWATAPEGFQESVLESLCEKYGSPTEANGKDTLFVWHVGDHAIKLRDFYGMWRRDGDFANDYAQIILPNVVFGKKFGAEIVGGGIHDGKLCAIIKQPWFEGGVRDRATIHEAINKMLDETGLVRMSSEDSYSLELTDGINDYLDLNIRDNYIVTEDGDFRVIDCDVAPHDESRVLFFDKNEETKMISRETDPDFEKKQYHPKYVKYDGAKSSDTLLEEPKGIAGVDAPKNDYRVNIDEKHIKNGDLQEHQLEAISYAGRAHEQTLDGGSRMGIMFGHRTGAGKGRMIAGTILDNFNQGRKRALWFTTSAGLEADARRDLKPFGLDGGLYRLADGAVKDGVGFGTYHFLRGEGAVDALAKKLGKGYDGVIAFDEIHRAKTEGGNTQNAVNKLQELLPNARVVYLSATGATEVGNFGYAQRLGLWGKGTPFKDFEEFKQKVVNKGVSAMELVARSMKMRGQYLAQGLSPRGVEFGHVEVKTTPEQQEAYQKVNEGLQHVYSGIYDALEAMDNLDYTVPASSFHGMQQRLHNSLVTAVKLPTLIEDAKKRLAAGMSPVFSLVNTNEAGSAREVAKATARGEELGMDEANFGPKQILLDFLTSEKDKEYGPDKIQYRDTQFPTFKPVKDNDGNIIGMEQSADAVAIRNSLIKEVEALPDAFGNPINMIVDAFGKDKVANLTGLNKTEFDSDYKAFQDGTKPVLVFSGKANTGFTYSTDKTYKNQRRRVGYNPQLGFRADELDQALGRLHRNNETSAPIYVTSSTDIPGERRFFSSVARRTGQLGALTRGDRAEAGGGVVTEGDNYENRYAQQAVDTLITRLARNGKLDMIAEKMNFIKRVKDGDGVKTVNTMIDENGVPRVSAKRFLNRLLMLKPTGQDAIFGAVDAVKKQLEQWAKDEGTFDYGRQEIGSESNDSLHSVQLADDVSIEHVNSHFKTDKKTFDEFAKDHEGQVFAHYRNKKTGEIFAVESDGTIHTRMRGDLPAVMRWSVDGTHERMLASRIEGDAYEKVSEIEAKSLWDTEYGIIPETRAQDGFYAKGDLLRHWDKVIGSSIPRTYSVDFKDDGFVGAKIEADDIPEILGRYGKAEEAKGMVIDGKVREILNNRVVDLVNGWKLKQIPRNGSNAIMIRGVDPSELEAVAKQYDGEVSKKRVFMKPDEAVLKKIIEEHPANLYRNDELIGDTGNLRFFDKNEESGYKKQLEDDAVYMDAVKRGDMYSAQRMVNEKADRILEEFNRLNSDVDEKGFKYHRGPAPKKTRTMYAVFNVGSDGFRAAYAGNANATPVGVWLDAQNLKAYTSSNSFDDSGRPLSYIPGDTGASWKAKGLNVEELDADGVRGKGFLLQRGGKHGSSVPNFAQMNTKVNEAGEKVSSAAQGALPHNKLIFEIEVGMGDDGDLTDFVKTNGRMVAGKNQGLAEIQPNQYYSFKTNPNANGEWGIAGTFRIKRLVPHSEVVAKTEEANKEIRLHNANLSKGEKPIREIPLQKWVGGYRPEDSGISVESVDEMYRSGLKKKLLDPVTYDDDGNVIPLSQRFNQQKNDLRFFNIDEEAADRVNAKGKDEAEKMLLAGEDRRKIWEKTGWWKAADGKWRYEIKGVDDATLSKMIDTVKNSGRFYDKDSGSTSVNSYAFTLKDLEGEYRKKGLDFPTELKTLMTAYPRIGNARIVLDYMNRADVSTLGYSSGKEIRLYSNGMTADTFNHELQHKIQDYGGMGRGTNTSTKSFERYTQEHGEWEARQAGARAGMSEAELHSIAPWETTDRWGVNESDTKIDDFNKTKIRPDGVAAPEEPEPVPEKKSTLWQKYKTNFIDRMDPLRQAEEEHGRAKGALYVANSPYNAMRLLPGKNEASRIRYENEWKKPFEKMLKIGGLTIDDVDRYMMCRDAKDRNAKILKRNGKLEGSGISDADAADMLADMKRRFSPAKYAMLEKAAAHLWKMQDEGMDRRVQSGRLDKTTVEQWRAEEPFHVPMRDDLSKDGELNRSTRQWTRAEFRTAEGRKTVADSPVAFMFREYQDAVYGSNINEARRVLADYVKAHSDIGKIYTGVRKGKTWSFTHRMIEDVPDPHYHEQTVIGGEGVENMVSFKEDGKLKSIELNGELGKRIAGAVIGRKGVQMFDGGLRESSKAIQKATRLWASTATEWSPTFVGRNFTADMLEASLNTIADKGVIRGGASAVKNIVNALRMTRTIATFNRTGKYKGKFANVMREYVESGAAIGGMGNEGYSELRTEMEAVHEKPTIKDHFKLIGRAISLWNKQAELATRLATFKDARDSGYSLGEAAMRSREYSTDFNKYGNQRWMNSVWMFSNSVMQSTVRQLESMHYGKHGKQLVTALIAYGAIEALAEHFCNTDEDAKNKREGEPTGETMSEYSRANSLYFRIGKKYIRIPFHAGPFSVLKYIGNATVRAALGDMKWEDWAKNCSSEASGTAVHFMGTGDAGPTIYQTFAPTLLQPFVQHNENLDFAGRPIKKQMFSKTKPYSENGRKMTGEGYKMAARALNSATGGDEKTRGVMDFAPETLKHFTTSIGKNVLRDVEGVFDFVTDMVEGREVDKSHVPFYRDYIRDVSGNTESFYQAETAFQQGIDNGSIRKDSPRATLLRGLIKEIRELRHKEDGEVKTKSGSYKKLLKPSDKQKEKYQKIRMMKQQKVIDLMKK